MKLRVMAIRDSAVGAFMRPFFVQSVGQGNRSFADEVNREAQDNTMYQHPEDYSLWDFGTFDDTELPHFETVVPVCIAKAVDLKR